MSVPSLLGEVASLGCNPAHMLLPTATSPRSGGYLNRDLAGYHAAADAGVETIGVSWTEEQDPHPGPTGD